ncbi:MAG: glycosyltransferase [Blautia wexlerae]
MKLWIMGSMEEAEDYAEGCRAMVRDMDIRDVEFTGIIDVKEYIGRMDLLILTSISEGQPLSILEELRRQENHILQQMWGTVRG